MKRVILIILAILAVVSPILYLEYTAINVKAGGIISIRNEANPQQLEPVLSDWIIKFEPSGTHVADGFLKVRLDFYPSEDSKAYVHYYVDVLDRPPTEEEIKDPKLFDLIPTHKELTPALCAFVKVPADIDKTQLSDYVLKVFNADMVATLEDIVIQSDSSHLISSYLYNKLRTAPSVSKTAINPEILVDDTNIKLKDFVASGTETGVSEPVIPKSIDVGGGAIDGYASLGINDQTIVDLTNPANASGTIDTYEIWVAGSTTGTYAAMFYGSGTSYTCRDYESIGNVSASSKQTFSGLDIDVSSGDFIGFYNTSGGTAEIDDGDGVYTYSGSGLTGGAKTYSYDGAEMSCTYATGSEFGSDQTAFRFRDDDDDEDEATWLDIENDDISRDKNTNTRIRMQVAIDGDAASSGYQLEHKLSTDSAWSKVTDTPAITFGVATASATTGAPGRTGDGDITCTLPTSWAIGDFAVMVVYNDDGDASTPTNWTEITGSPFGADTPKMCIFTKFLANGESDPVTTISGSGSGVSHVAAIATYKGVDLTTPVEVIGTATSGTGTPMTAGTINTLTNNAWAVCLSGRGDNENSGSQTFGGSATGVTERFDSGTNQGGDSQVSLYDKEISSYGATGDGSSTTSVTDPFISVIIALKPFTPYIMLSASSNIPASAATATTAQLSVPESRDFTAGAISDDTNPITVDIAVDRYTELEWCFKITDSAASSNIFDLRVTIDGAALTTYTNTPQITYSTGGTPSIANTPSSKAFGVVNPSSTYYAGGSSYTNPVQDGECNFTITNDGAIAIDIDIKESNPTGGVGWTLTIGSPGENTIRDTAVYSGLNPASGIVLTTSDQSFYDNLAASATLKWDFKRETGTFTDGAQKTSTITLTASAH